MARTTGSHSTVTGPRIREAAQRLFARDGFAAVSMRRIAAEVGVQAGALYNYTPDKQSLLHALMESHMDEVMEGWGKADVAGDAMARLQAFTRFHIGFHLERPDAVFIAYMELRNLTGDNFAAIEARRRGYEDVLETILRQGVKEGAFAIVDTKIATLAVISMLNGVNTWFHVGGRLSLADVEEIYWDMVRKSVAV